MSNKHRKVWKVIFRKPLSGKQTQPKGKQFPENQTKFFFDWKVFPLTGKCFFPLINFSNGKQTQENLESDFLKTTFQETNTALI
jgi:hypothetical protein